MLTQMIEAHQFTPTVRIFLHSVARWRISGAVIDRSASSQMRICGRPVILTRKGMQQRAQICFTKL